MSRKSFSRRTLPTALLAVACVALAWPAMAQLPNSAHIGYVYPAGGRVGTTFQVHIGGQFLDGVSDVLVDGAGVSAKVIDYVKPPGRGQWMSLRRKWSELREKAQTAANAAKAAGNRPTTGPVFTPEDERMLAEVVRQLVIFERKPFSVFIQETVIVQVTVAKDAPPTQRELRLVTPTGLSNPLIFSINQQPEFAAEEPKLPTVAEYQPTFNDFEPQTQFPAKTGVQGETPITVPAIINGRILPGTVHRYRFKAFRGLKLVVSVNARSLVPYIADAVPGWFQAVATLRSIGKGTEITYSDHFFYNQDPVILYDIPANDEYYLDIRDSIYRGREDFVYRISVGPLPFVTSRFPLGGQVGTQTTVELMGWNLPSNKVVVDTTNQQPGIMPLYVHNDRWNSNRVPFAVDTLPECLEIEPNDTPEKAQEVTLPIMINGRIDKPGDVDVFKFNGKAGDKVVAEVYARRLNSPLDSLLKLKDASGKVLAENDDFEDKAAGLVTHHADSYISTTLPADGTYYLYLVDNQHQGGPEYAYRLRISAPMPDFVMRVVPSSVAIRPGGTFPLTVYAVRRDGFADAIDLELKDPPAGFKLSAAKLPAGKDSVKLTLSAPQTPSTDLFTLHVEGHATILGQQVTHAAVPAEDMMQAFAYRHLVPFDEMKVRIAGKPVPPPRFPLNQLSVCTPVPLKIPQNGQLRLFMVAPISSAYNKMQFTVVEPTEGIAIKEFAAVEAGVELVLQSDVRKLRPGTKGNLVLSCTTELLPNDKPPRPGTPDADAPPGRRALGQMAPVPFEIVPR